MGSRASSMRFNPPPNWPTVPSGWVPPAGWEPDPRWGPAPAEWPLWVGDEVKPGWAAHRKVLTGVAGGFLGLMLLLVLIGAVSSGSADGSNAAVAADTSEPAVDKAAAEKAAADKTAADKTIAEKAAADKAAAEEQRSSLPKGTDCQWLATRAVQISSESTDAVKIIEVRTLKILKDNRTSFKIPAGSTRVLVLSCTGQAVASTGAEGVRVLVTMTVDSGSGYLVGLEEL